MKSYKNYKEKLKKHFIEVAKIKKSPHSIAMGFAIGTLIAILPTFGLGIFIGLLVILIFPKISKVSMMIAFVIWNPIILYSLIPIEYKIGDLIVGDAPIVRYEFEFLNWVFNHTKRYLIGSAILSIFTSIVAYIFALIFSYKLQKKHSESIKEEITKLKETLKV